MMRDATYGGVNAAVLTPMNEDLSVDLDRLAAHCRWLLGNGCNGLGVLGTTGEANSLGVSERLALLDGLAERGVPGRRMLPGVGTTAITDTVLLARKAAEVGCAGALVLPPFFYKNPSDNGLVAYIGELVQRLGGALKIYLYHFPAQSAVPWTHALVGRLLRAFPGAIAGIKDSSGDLENTLGYVREFASEGFEVYCGDDGALHDVLRAGGAGCITAASNVGCSASARVYAGWDGDEAAEAQKVVSAVRRAVAGPNLIPGLKALVARNTGDEGWSRIRPPLLPLAPDAAQALFRTFDATGLTLAAA